MIYPIRLIISPFKLLSIIDDERFHMSISVPLILEYEDAIKREKSKIGLNYEDIEAILDFIYYIGKKKGNILSMATLFEGSKS